MTKKKLNPKQEKFCAEYLVDLNATQAAIRAGYSAKTAGSQAHDLLKKPEIAAHIQILRGKLAEKTQITPERVLAEYAKIAFFDPRRLFDGDGNPLKINELDADTAAVIAGLEVSSTVLKDEAAEQDEEGGEITRKDALNVVRKYKIADKKTALDSIARHLGMFAPVKHEVTGKDGKELLPQENPDMDAARRIAFVLAKAVARQGTVLGAAAPAAGAAAETPEDEDEETVDPPEEDEDREDED